MHRPLLVVALVLAGCGGAPRPAPAPPATSAAAPCPAHVATDDGALLFAERTGAEDRPPVVLVHDWGHDATVFDELVAGLIARYPVVTYDLRGHGRSTDPGEGGDLERHLADLLAVLDRHAPGVPAHLVGHGAGGWIALEAARRHPARVRSVALVSTTLGTPEPLAAELAALVREPVARWRSRLIPVFLGDDLLETRPDLLARFDLVFARHQHASVAGTAAALLLAHEVTPEDLAAQPRPVLVLYGARDESPAAFAAEAALADLPDVIRLRIPGAGRAPFLGDPAATLRALARFWGT